MTDKLSNWAGNYTYTAANVHYPETIEQMQEIVRGSRKIRALGSRHSFNSIADSLGDLISLEQLPRQLSIDREGSTVTVNGGAKYGEICAELNREGYALHNLASLPHISVAGACATATHGSGERNGSLVTAVVGLELVRADGEVVALEGEQLEGAVVGLGALGVVTKVKLKVEPAYEMRQVVYENLRLSQLEAHFDVIEASGYSVSLFTDWRGEAINQVWVKSRVETGAPFEIEPDLFGATAANVRLHPIAGVPALHCTEQLGIPGPWYERLPHFRMDFTPSSGEELQTEYLVPRQHALAAIRAIHDLKEQIAPLLQISEIRTIAADNLWLSPFYKQDCIGLHFTWQKNWPAVSALLPMIEERLAPFNARPHWGKLFTMQHAYLQSLYEKLPDFRQLAQEYDPEGKFRNAFLDEYVFEGRPELPY